MDSFGAQQQQQAGGRACFNCEFYFYHFYTYPFHNDKATASIHIHIYTHHFFMSSTSDLPAPSVFSTINLEVYPTPPNCCKYCRLRLAKFYIPNGFTTERYDGQ
jgi:hypothetical protein